MNRDKDLEEVHQKLTLHTEFKYKFKITNFLPGSNWLRYRNEILITLLNFYITENNNPIDFSGTTNDN